MAKKAPVTFDYQKRAEECSLHAATAANDEAREVWRQMEAYWLKRAGQAKSTGKGPPRK